MEHIVLIDHNNKKCEYMQSLREDVINLIQSNVCTIQLDNRNIQIASADVTFPTEYIKKLGYEHDQGLYDKLIIEYNNNHPDKLLTRWPRHK